MKQLRKAAAAGVKAYGETLARQDAWQNVLTGLGNINKDRLMGHQIQGSAPTTPAELNALYHDDPLARKIGIKPVQEALRQGISWASSADIDPDTATEVAERIEAEFTRLELLERVKAAAVWSRVFGLGAVLLGADGDMIEPIPPALPRPLDYAITMERYSHRVRPVEFWGAGEPGPLGEPKVYEASRVGHASQIYRMHVDRLLVFEGEPTTWEQRQLNEYCHYSILHWCKDPLRNYNSLLQSIGNMATDASTAVLKIKGFHDSMIKSNSTAVKARLAIVELAKMVGRIMPLDTDQEAYEVHDRTFSGLPELVDRQEAQVASAADMSITMLFGRSPAGMNATGESDARNDMNTVKALQDQLLAPQLNKATRMIAGYLGAPEPDSWHVEFPSLWQRDPDQEAAHIKSIAETDAIWIQNEVVTPEEVAETRFARTGEFDDGPPRVDLSLRAQEEPAPMDDFERRAMEAEDRLRALEAVPPQGDPDELE